MHGEGDFFSIASLLPGVVGLFFRHFWAHDLNFFLKKYMVVPLLDEDEFMELVNELKDCLADISVGF